MHSLFYSPMTFFFCQHWARTRSQWVNFDYREIFIIHNCLMSRQRYTQQLELWSKLFCYCPRTEQSINACPPNSTNSLTAALSRQLYVHSREYVTAFFTICSAIKVVFCLGALYSWLLNTRIIILISSKQDKKCLSSVKCQWPMLFDQILSKKSCGSSRSNFLDFFTIIDWLTSAVE